MHVTLSMPALPPCALPPSHSLPHYSLVISVDPGALHPAALKPNVVHLCMKAEDAGSRIRDLVAEAGTEVGEGRGRHGGRGGQGQARTPTTYSRI